MAQVKEGDRVKVHYAGRLEDGTEFDSSAGAEPLEFTVGRMEVIPGFEQSVIGMVPGEAKTVTMPAEQGYGPHLEEMVAVMERKDLPGDLVLALGDRLEVSQEGGETFIAEVTALDDATVTLDANHPLAGRALTFDLTLVEIA